MTSNALVVVATLKAKSGKAAELRSAFLELERHSRTEKGCIKYDLHQSIEDPDTFLFYEIWADEEALALHANSDFMNASRKITRDLVESRVLQKFHLVS
jgi:quinol monooxygenase YgiN